MTNEVCLTWHFTSQWCEVSLVGDSRCSPHPVSCQCPVPADYCTLVPESDVPEEWNTFNTWFFTRPAISSSMVTEAADTLRCLRCISILPKYRWDEQWKFTGQPARVTVGKSACSDLDSTSFWRLIPTYLYFWTEAGGRYFCSYSAPLNWLW